MLSGYVRGIVLFIATAVFGLFLAFFGQQMGLFDGETGWFAIAIFAVAWLVVAALMWRYSKGGPAPRP
jgi:hypothetical protein